VVAGALVVWATSAVALRTGLLPRWFGWLGILVGIIQLFAILFFPVFAYWGWIVVAAALLCVAAGCFARDSGASGEIGEVRPQSQPRRAAAAGGDRLRRFTAFRSGSTRERSRRRRGSFAWLARFGGRTTVVSPPNLRHGGAVTPDAVCACGEQMTSVSVWLPTTLGGGQPLPGRFRRRSQSPSVYRRHFPGLDGDQPALGRATASR
jgi:hypothetical protein